MSEISSIHLIGPTRREISYIDLLGAKSRRYRFSLSLGVRRTRDCWFEDVLMRFEENFSGMNWSVDDFGKRNSDGGRSIYMHFYFLSLKKFFIALQWFSKLLTSTNKYLIFQFYEPSQTFCRPLFDTTRELTNSRTTFPIDWYSN